MQNIKIKNINIIGKSKIWFDGKELFRRQNNSKIFRRPQYNQFTWVNHIDHHCAKLPKTVFALLTISVISNGNTTLTVCYALNSVFSFAILARGNATQIHLQITSDYF